MKSLKQEFIETTFETFSKEAKHFKQKEIRKKSRKIKNISEILSFGTKKKQNDFFYRK